MKAIKILKKFRNGEVNHILFIHDKADSSEIKEAVEYWAEDEGSGINYGYRLEWSEATDREEIKTEIREQMKHIDSKVESLLKHKEDLKEYLFTLID